MHPTQQIYDELQSAYDHFNKALFDDALPDCLITLQRERRTFGYYCRDRFVNHGGTITDEIAMNPAYFGIRSIRKSLSTLVHEMVHQWQIHFGKPGRRGYHNKEWADKMDALGLIASNTGQPGGKRVGEQMDHYIQKGGAFDQACDSLLSQQYRLSWLDRFPPYLPSKPSSLDETDEDEQGDLDDGHLKEDYVDEDEEGHVSPYVQLPKETVNKTNRQKYRCPVCESQAWGKPGLQLICGGEGCDKARFNVV
ncbi:SprT-like domain-containing protein [Halomonas sp. 3A7M]|uniref:SprT-like domain-containing protein n=1 Tax=Halomonas sp. 3A7M TaxID=2742616 RepID=UPI001866A35D|nr:SprT-like domain-containing protein [Halomonas sp. 3A7M]